VERNTKPQNKT